MPTEILRRDYGNEKNAMQETVLAKIADGQSPGVIELETGIFVKVMARLPSGRNLDNTGHRVWTVKNTREAAEAGGSSFQITSPESKMVAIGQRLLARWVE